MSRNTYRPRAKTFRAWFAANLKDSARDIAECGADAGYPYITYTSDTVLLYDKYEADIYEMLNEDAESMGFDSPEALIATFRRQDMLAWPEGRKNLLVWYAAERLAREMVE